MFFLQRRARRSVFFIGKSLFNAISNKEVEEASKTNLGLLLGVSVAGVGLASYMVAGQGEEELPGDLEKEEQAAVEDLETAKITEPEGVTSEPSVLKEESKAVEDPSFWSRLSTLFSSKTIPETPVQTKEAIAKIAPTATPINSKKLGKDFRSTFKFEGFSGASLLSTKGRYTQDEANTIIRLKMSKAKTSASSSMSEQIADLIRETAVKYGVDPKLALKVAKMESGGNPNAISKTGAIGIYQFTGGTASDFGLVNRFDAAANIDAGVRYIAKNSARAMSDKLPINETSLYLMHQLGYNGAKALFRAASRSESISDLPKSLQRAVRLNYGGNSVKTAADYIRKTSEGLQRRYQSVKVVSSSATEPAASPVKPIVASVARSNAEIKAEPVKSVQAATVKVSAKDLVVPVSSETPSSSRASQPAYPNRKHPPQSLIRTSSNLLVSNES